MLYHAFTLQGDLLWPLRAAVSALAGSPAAAAAAAAPRVAEAGGGHPVGRVLRDTGRRARAVARVLDLLRLSHARPSYGIDTVDTPAGPVPVAQHVVTPLPFGDLLHFRKVGVASPGPRVLVVAPMSGHFATLLRDTVRTLLADHDVFITDWHNARDVPLWQGGFGFDAYVATLIDFVGTMGAEGRPVHLVAVCQPCVAALAAAALMAEDDHPAQPRSITLMAGPVDCRVNPTRVNTLANAHPIAWFESRLLSWVPARHAGAWRRVYPGFLQLTAFMSMNLERHRQALAELVHLLLDDDPAAQAKAASTIAFYEEYFAVADLPAEFYLETVQRVFQEVQLARGMLQWRDRRVDPGAIRRTALLTVEGEKDDICAIGQTLAAQDLCTGIRPYLKQHHLQSGVGHYGVFSGRRWQQMIYPRLRDMVHVMDER